jgi:CDGSH-type Zn-finger protein
MIADAQGSRENRPPEDRPGEDQPRRYRIKITVDGPYVVSGGAPLQEQIVSVDDQGEPHGWREGRTYQVEGEYALCRCGHSQRMPFCDGGHAGAGFDGTETALEVPYAEQAERFEGPGLVLSDAETLCAATGFCHRQGGTWELTRRSADAVARATAIEEACDCPSGRLVAWEKDGRAIEPDLDPSLGLVEEPNGRMGPIWVRGGIPVQSAEGKTHEVRNRVTLCRCGRSNNKPFCDGGHRD